MENCDVNKGLYEVAVDCSSDLMMSWKTNKGWWYCKILLGSSVSMEMMLWNGNHFLAQTHHLIKNILLAAQVIFSVHSPAH